MPARYLILHQQAGGDVPHPAFDRVAGDPLLQCVAEGAGWWVLASPDCPGLGEGTAGVLGRLFRSRSGIPPSPMVLRPDEATVLANAGGRFLLTSAWGSYVAWHVRADGLEIVRDPSGALPCYAVVEADVSLVTNDLRLAEQALQRSFPVDPLTIGHALRYRDLRGRATCLTGVSEILPGEVVCLARGKIVSMGGWTPSGYLRDRADVPSIESATRLLRNAVSETTAAFLRDCQRPLVIVSGGLDSSVVAARIATLGVTPSLLTLVYPGASGDERRFARPLADYLGLALSEAGPDASMIDLALSEAAELPRPAARSFAQAGDRLLIERADDEGFDSVFNGNGGDAAFGYLLTALPLVDRLREAGGWRDAWRLIKAMADVHDVTIWEALARSMRASRASDPGYPWPADPTFLCDASKEPDASMRHPWLEELDGIAPGKIAQIRSLASAHHHFEGTRLADHVPILSPLLAQPVLEASLLIPTWYGIEGGRNRAIARRAFADMLPDAIVRRTTKGGPEGICLQLYDRELSRIRDMLLGGRLRQWGIIDGAAVEAALDTEQTRLDHRYFRLLSLLDAEVWVRAREAAIDPGAARTKAMSTA
jgi:asparagine synthase (glutamine-hydrolysing)